MAIGVVLLPGEDVGGKDRQLCRTIEKMTARDTINMGFRCLSIEKCGFSGIGEGALLRIRQ